MKLERCVKAFERGVPSSVPKRPLHSYSRDLFIMLYFLAIDCGYLMTPSIYRSRDVIKMNVARIYFYWTQLCLSFLRDNESDVSLRRCSKTPNTDQVFDFHRHYHNSQRNCFHQHIQRLLPLLLLLKYKIPQVSLPYITTWISTMSSVSLLSLSSHRSKDVLRSNNTTDMLFPYLEVRPVN
jgi:hypothetical protein